MNGSGQPLGVYGAQGKTPEKAAGPSPGGFLGCGWGKEAMALFYRKPQLMAQPSRSVPWMSSLVQGKL